MQETVTLTLTPRQKEFDALLIAGLQAGVVIPEGSDYDGPVQFIFFADAHMLCVRGGKDGIKDLFSLIAVTDSAHDGSLTTELLNLRERKEAVETVERGNVIEKLFWQPPDGFAPGEETVRLGTWVTVEDVPLPKKVFDPEQTLPPDFQP